MYLEYPSSQDPDLRLFAEFEVPTTPKPLLVQMHGWHGQVKKAHSDNVLDLDEKELKWMRVLPEMRGRGDATGKEDCNGWELQDVVDAVNFARTEFADKILTPDLVTLQGGSGGGGNVLGLVGKFPDFFCRAIAECVISDYGLWYMSDTVGEFRDEIESAGWIGGTPESNAEAYASRGGATTAANLLTPLLIVHGDNDPRTPVEQARLYIDRAKAGGKKDLLTYHEMAGVGTPGHFGGATEEQMAERDRVRQKHLATPSHSIDIPRAGRFVVAGYLRTKAFEVTLDSVDHIGQVAYDLDANTFTISAPSSTRAILRIRRPDGTWEERNVEPGNGRRK
jgi:Prolyl oligopeptidase family